MFENKEKQLIIAVLSYHKIFNIDDVGPNEANLFF